jgi:hypothetical protein
MSLNWRSRQQEQTLLEQVLASTKRTENLMTTLNDDVNAALVALAQNVSNPSAVLAASQAAVVSLQAQLDAANAGDAVNVSELQTVLTALTAANEALAGQVAAAPVVDPITPVVIDSAAPTA